MTPARAEPLVEQVADHIRIWSGQKQVLADRLADLRSGPVADIVDLHENPVPLVSWDLEAPPAPPLPVVEDLWEPAPIDHWMPVTEELTVASCSQNEQGEVTGSGPTNGRTGVSGRSTSCSRWCPNRTEPRSSRTGRSPRSTGSGFG